MSAEAVFADTNFLIAVYFQRGGGSARAWLVEHCSRVGPLLVSRLVVQETVNAIERLVFESRNGAAMRVTPEIATVVQSSLQEDLSAGAILQEMPVEAGELQFRYRELVLRHTAKHGFRSYDMLHVASAKVLECESLWPYDQKAAQLAVLEGLLVLD